VDYGGHSKWTVPLAHACCTPGKISVRKGSVTNVHNLFCIFMIEWQKEVKTATILLSLHAGVDGKCNTVGGYMLK
jgi:hypothetical protein